jgi:hypothetical protein
MMSTQQPERRNYDASILDGTIKGLRGKNGNLIFRQLPNGTTVVTQAQPKKNSRQKKRAKLKRSPRQKAQARKQKQAER